MRMITGEMDVFTCEPHNDLLSNRADNGAYTIANPGKEYAVYFPKGGSVDINLSLDEKKDAKTVTIRWLNIRKSEWKKQEENPLQREYNTVCSNRSTLGSLDSIKMRFKYTKCAKFFAFSTILCYNIYRCLTRKSVLTPFSFYGSNRHVKTSAKSIQT